MSILLSNLPIDDLTPQTDYLNVIERGDMIKSFLLSNKEDFNQIKMFALYGEWGSGKSTLMKYLEKELKSDFNTFFFEAWEFENSGNLSLSLLEYLNDTSFVKEQFKDSILELGEKIFRGVGKSVKVDIPLFPGGPKIAIDPSKLVDELSKKNESFYKSKKEFKTKFKQWEDFASKGDNPKYNIVFIDDLDRCEPENVLNLLSALKLFFTYGQKTIFFCGIDKKAAEAAIKTKYGDVVKSEEYLEKVFDISFKMSKITDIDKLIAHYFPDDIGFKFQDEDKKLYKIISELFSFLRFQNPRKIKKVLNKFLIFKALCKSLPENHEYEEMLPKVFDKVVFFDLLFTIYFLILIEFEPEKFDNVHNNSLRIINYNLAEDDSNEAYHITTMEYFDSISNEPGFLQSKMLLGESIDKGLLASVIFCFTPTKPERIKRDFLENSSSFVDGFKVSKREIDYRFCNYFLINIKDILNQKMISFTSISDMYKLVKLMN